MGYLIMLALICHGANAFVKIVAIIKNLIIVAADDD